MPIALSLIKQASSPTWSAKLRSSAGRGGEGECVEAVVQRGSGKSAFGEAVCAYVEMVFYRGRFWR